MDAVFVSWQWSPTKQEAEIGPSDLGKKANSSFSGFWSMESLHKIGNRSMDIQIVMGSAV